MNLHPIILVFFLTLYSCKNETKSTQHFSKVDCSLAGGEIQRIENFPSKNISKRNVDIWLPNGYSTAQKYAVLYMHDGQMLFDANKTWNKQEWGVDEVATHLQSQDKVKNFIVVGIHNIAESRFVDYFPQKSIHQLTQKVRDSIEGSFDKKGYSIKESALHADAYLKFIVSELKPFIDANYSTYKEKEHTAIMGSSMGGLISMYAFCEYPEVFGAAACLSTHWIGTHNYNDSNPVPTAIFSYLQQNLPSPVDHKVYFDFGTETLDQHYVKYENDVANILLGAGYASHNSKNIKFEGADHTENSWEARLEIPITFLMKK